MFKIGNHVRVKDNHNLSGEIRGFGQLINRETNEPQTIVILELDSPFYSDENDIHVTIYAVDISNIELEPFTNVIDPRD